MPGRSLPAGVAQLDAHAQRAALGVYRGVEELDAALEGLAGVGRQREARRLADAHAPASCS